MRLGAAILLAKSDQMIKSMFDSFENSARAIWSNVNNGWMENFTKVISTNSQKFLQEKQKYIDILKRRSKTFIDEAQSCDLDIYPYHEGFFITIKITDPEFIQAYHQALMDKNIFTVKLTKGIRVAICSVPLVKLQGLAKKMKIIYDKTKKE
jgi:aspartate aminotransferase/aromatic-amino-acid transaminase